MRRYVLALFAAVLLAACGSGAPVSQAPTQAAQPSRAQSTQPGQGGQPIDTAAIQAAVAALKAHDSWQFTVTTYESGTPNFSRNVTGTQRSNPQAAVSATFSQSGQPDKRYVQIGDDVWYDAGTGSYVQTTASDNAVISQFQPYYLEGLVSSAQGNGYQFQPVGPDTVSAVTTTHYRLADATIQSIVQPMNGLTAADWAADVWIADADGSLMRLAWGPQSVDKAQLQTGFNYVVTSIDCTCPVDPPA